MLPVEITCSEIASEAIWDKSRAVVAVWLTEHCIQFLAVLMHLPSQVTSNFHERRYYTVGRTALLAVTH